MPETKSRQQQPLIHGTSAAYFHGQCRCESCRDYGHRYYLSRKGQPKKPREYPDHGTYRRYHRGCRCEPCRQAIAAYNRQRYCPHPRAPVPLRHGTNSGYNRKCRCEPCRQAHAQAMLASYYRNFRSLKVPAPEARHLLESLLSQGWTLNRIAQASGISRPALDDLQARRSPMVHRPVYERLRTLFSTAEIPGSRPEGRLNGPTPTA